MQAIQDTLLPILSIFLTALVPVLIGVIIKFFQKMGIEIDGERRDALQSALENAAALAVNKMATAPTPGSNFLALPVANIALAYILNSVPDALKHFGLDKDEGKLIDLLRPHIAKAIQKKFPLTPAQ